MDKPNIRWDDVAGLELPVEGERSVRENVEQTQLERRADGRCEPFPGRCDRLVTERGGGGEVGLDCLDVPFDVHVTSV